MALWVAGASAGLMADAYISFDGHKSTWHEGCDRYDYLIDETSLEIQPFERDESEHFGIADPPPGKRRCVVVAPLHTAFGNPWSWRGCYWDHQPQVEVEAVLHRLHVRRLDEEELVTRLRVGDHALLVTRLVRVVGQVGVTEDRLPPLRELVGVAAVDGGVRDVRRHAATLAGATSGSNRVTPRGLRRDRRRPVRRCPPGRLRR